jgi:histidinol-phosphate aminotransferase
MANESALANPWLRTLPNYEPGRPIEDVAREMGLDPASIVKLASNENALGPSPRALAAIRAAGPSMHLYPDSDGFYLREALAARLGVGASQVVLANGSCEIIQLLAQLLLGPGTSLVISDRAFLMYPLVAAMYQARTIAVPMRGFTHDLEAMAAAIRPDTRLVFVANPNNPTGTAVEPDAVARFMDRVPDHAVVALDEAYVELLPPAERPDSLRGVREGRRAIVLRTFSKAYGLAGLRIGYGVASEELIALLRRIRPPFSANAMAQAAALAALDDEDHVARTRAMTIAGLAQLEAGCARLGLACVPSRANFILVKVGDGRTVFGKLQRRGVIVRPVDNYGLPEYVRVTVGTEAENERLLAALAGMGTRG